MRVGTAGWHYEDWKGLVYGRGDRSHPLSHISQWFDAVEVNVTFYRHVNPANAANWAHLVEGNQRFRFVVKAWQGFTHGAGREIESSELKRFKEGVQPLAEAGMLGCVLAQFPWSFRRTKANRAYLAGIVDALGPWPVVVEFRHASWDTPETLAGMRERGVAFCNIDQPLFQDSLAPTGYVTSRIAYVRLHGRNHEHWFREESERDDRYNYLYTGEELKPWLARIEQLRKLVDAVFVITNNHYRGQAVVNALELQDRLGIGPNVGRLPETLVAAYPQLAEVVARRHG